MIGHEIVSAAERWREETSAELDRLRRDWERLREGQRQLLLALARLDEAVRGVCRAARAVDGAEIVVLREGVGRG